MILHKSYNIPQGTFHNKYCHTLHNLRNMLHHIHNHRHQSKCHNILQYMYLCTMKWHNLYRTNPNSLKNMLGHRLSYKYLNNLMNNCCHKMKYNRCCSHQYMLTNMYLNMKTSIPNRSSRYNFLNNLTSIRLCMCLYSCCRILPYRLSNRFRCSLCTLQSNCLRILHYM